MTPHQQRMLMAGKCRLCGKDRQGNPQLCPRCVEKRNRKRRARKQYDLESMRWVNAVHGPEMRWHSVAPTEKLLQLQQLADAGLPLFDGPRKREFVVD
jgi:hypothetical protein